MKITELSWFKSSESGGSCVEVALAPFADPKTDQRPQLTLSPTPWTSFVSYAAQV